MINPNYIYTDGRSGRVIIIDFGVSFKHTIQEKLTPATIMDILDINYQNDNPVFGNGILATSPQYQWLRVADGDRQLWVDAMLQFSDNRDIAKAEFLSHINNASSCSLKGGNTRRVTSSLVRKNIKLSRGSTYNIRRKSNKMCDKKSNNIFDKLDPDNIFTRTFITKYIQDELQNSTIKIKRRRNS